MPDVKVANIQLSASACQDTQETHSMHVASSAFPLCQWYLLDVNQMTTVLITHPAETESASIHVLLTSLVPQAHCARW
jgi:hypothetical protein